MTGPATFDDVEACIDAMLSAVGRRIVLGIPLGTGKPNRFVNALYRRACADPGLKLSIFTALTPRIPKGRTLLERRFLDPIRERLYGTYEALDYAEAVAANALPLNVEIAEFYFAPGSWLGSGYAQRQHVSANYSQVTRTLVDRGVNVVAQMIASDASGGQRRLSLGSNPDLILDLARGLPPDRRPFLIGQVSSAMPFLPNDAETPADFWDALIEPSGDLAAAPLFAVPNKPVALSDYAIATHVASLVEDGGTLQIGIGSLGDAIAHVLRLRQTDNATYLGLVDRLIGEPEQSLRAALPVRSETFEAGLYGSSEMLVEGLLHLIEAGVVKRRVPAVAGSDPSIFLHAAFFLGSPALYRSLHELDDDTRNGIEMTGVRFVNTLDDDYARKRGDRGKARFVNSAMMVTLDGAVISDGLEGKRVVSGVGGQHDFVGMAQHLPDARSIIVLPAARTKRGRTASNIVFEHGHTTVPRQFRDIVVTEYGAADLRGAGDRDVMVALLNVTDSRFQHALLAEAQAAGKIERGYRIPDAFRANLPASLARRFTPDLRAKLPHFPLSSDFSADEARLAVALAYLKAYAGSGSGLAGLLLGPLRRASVDEPLLERMELATVRGIAERLGRRLLRRALAETESGRPLLPLETGPADTI